MIDAAPIYLLLDLQASIYAINDALVKKGICDADFLQKRKNFYQDKLTESLKVLKDIQTGEINRDEAQAKIEELAAHLVWDTTINQPLDKIVQELNKDNDV